MTAILRANSSAERVLEYDATVMPRVDADGSVYFVAEHPDLPGCRAHGSTPSEALDNLVEALDLYREMARASGAKVPEPSRDPHLTIGQHVVPSQSTTGTRVLRGPVSWSWAKGTSKAPERPAVETVVASSS